VTDHPPKKSEVSYLQKNRNKFSKAQKQVFTKNTSFIDKRKKKH